MTDGTQAWLQYPVWTEECLYAVPKYKSNLHWQSSIRFTSAHYTEIAASIVELPDEYAFWQPLRGTILCTNEDECHKTERESSPHDSLQERQFSRAVQPLTRATATRLDDYAKRWESWSCHAAMQHSHQRLFQLSHGAVSALLEADRETSGRRSLKTLFVIHRRSSRCQQETWFQGHLALLQMPKDGVVESCALLFLHGGSLGGAAEAGFCPLLTVMRIPQR